MSCKTLEEADYTKLDTDAIHLPALQKFDSFIATQTPPCEVETDPETGIRRKLFLPGSLVSAPVTVNNHTFYWPAIVEFSPESESNFVMQVPSPNGDGEIRMYYVTLITIDRSSWFGAWVKRSTLRPFNVLTEPGRNGASHVPDADLVFNYVKEHLFMNNRDRLLKLSFMSFVAFNNNMHRWEIRF